MKIQKYIESDLYGFFQVKPGCQKNGGWIPRYPFHACES